MPLRAMIASSVEIDLDLRTRLEPLVIAWHDDEAVGPRHRGEHASAARSDRLDFSLPHELHSNEIGTVERRGKLAPQASPDAPVPSLFPLTEQELQALLSEARSRGSDADDIMTIYGHLTEIRTRIERLQGQLNALDNRATLSTVNLELVPTEAARPLTGDAWRPSDTVRSSLRSLMGALKALADLAIFLLVAVAPIGLILALVVWMLMKAWRRVRPRRRPAD